MAGKTTFVCYGCKQKFLKDQLVEYASPSAKILHKYCKACLTEKQTREEFSMAVCKIFGIKSPGPRIWTERKRLMDTYGYTDNAIIRCLDYIYNVEHKKKISETLYLVNPTMMDKMRQYYANQESKNLLLAKSINASVGDTFIAPTQENKKQKVFNYNPDDWLGEE